jgi:hypothetical protein
MLAENARGSRLKTISPDNTEKSALSLARSSATLLLFMFVTHTLAGIKHVGRAGMSKQVRMDAEFNASTLARFEAQPRIDGPSVLAAACSSRIRFTGISATACSIRCSGPEGNGRLSQVFGWLQAAS